MNYFYVHNGHEQQGPFDIEELKSQSLKRDTPIWYEGLEDWIVAEKIEELKILFQPIPPPLKKIVSPPISTIKGIPESTNDYSPDEFIKRKSYLKPLIIGGITIVVLLISWLVYQNQDQKEAIGIVQKQVATQDNEILKESSERQQKEADAQQKELAKQKATEALTKKNREYRNNWANYIGIGHSQYTYSALGGIDAFEVYVRNNTDYVLDEVGVDINYIKASGELYKTETITIDNIAPHSKKSGLAPSSTRGTSISTDILEIHSTKMHFCYGQEGSSNDQSDPYYCK